MSTPLIDLRIYFSLFDSNIINLGLDLRGGSEYLLSPKIDKWVLNNNEGGDTERNHLASAITDIMEDKGIKVDKSSKKYTLFDDIIEEDDSFR